MSLIREEVEHAYNSTRRLRQRLSALARLAVEHAVQADRATRVAAEATAVLEACACVFHLLGENKRPELLALDNPKELDELKLEQVSALQRLSYRFDLLQGKPALHLG